MSKANAYTIKITSKRQATFPRLVLESLGLKAGDQLVLRESCGSYVLEPVPGTPPRPRTLADRIPETTPPLDITTFRQFPPYDPRLRD
jgi:bifunctional DNA-binding transcriptional regulator/antitoxin component of YhaV-PrlF toxin-antitoxin module